MKLLIGLIGTLALTGCGLAFGGATGDGFTMSGSAEGLRAYFDGTNGLVTNARTQDPEGKSAHWALRAEQEVQQTQRKCSKCGFFSKLFGGSEQQKGS